VAQQPGERQVPSRCEILHPPGIRKIGRCDDELRATSTTGSEISVETSGSNYKVAIDGVEHVVDAQLIAGTLWSVLYGNGSFEVDVTRLPAEEFEVLIQGDCTSSP